METATEPAAQVYFHIHEPSGDEVPDDPNEREYLAGKQKYEN
jgi:hypothetical protein